MRLKYLREALNDASYAKQMQALPNPPANWPNALANLVASTTKGSRNYADYQELREKIGDYLDNRSVQQKQKQ